MSGVLGLLVFKPLRSLGLNRQCLLQNPVGSQVARHWKLSFCSVIGDVELVEEVEVKPGPRVVTRKEGVAVTVDIKWSHLHMRVQQTRHAYYWHMKRCLPFINKLPER